MTLQTHSVPLGCRECGSECIQQTTDYGENFLICHDCGVLIPSEVETRTELTASIVHCPHCESIDAITVWGGEESCNICGLDPSDPEPSAHALSHLWKARTPEMDDEKLIREIMIIPNKNGEPRFLASTGVGNFLRTVCGPHCSYSAECPQTTKNLSRCYREERHIEEDVMSKRGKGKNKIAKALRKEEKRLWNQLHSRAWLFSPPTGWFVSKQNYESETIYQEQSSTGGDQSGT